MKILILFVRTNRKVYLEGPDEPGFVRPKSRLEIFRFVRKRFPLITGRRKLTYRTWILGAHWAAGLPTAVPD